jgi:hypothetical protein
MHKTTGLNMQLKNAPLPAKFHFIETAMQTERLLRYLPAAGKDKLAAFQLYLWNFALCEAFYISLRFSEIVCRNAIHNRLLSRFGERWFNNATLLSLLDSRYKKELEQAVRDEKEQHGDNCTSHHIVSALTFAFWQHLLTKRFDRALWSQGVQVSFPNAPNRISREELYLLVESVRKWRNRIAHHRAIFDNGPMKKHQDALHLIQWACVETANWVAAVSKVPSAIALRPR